MDEEQKQAYLARQRDGMRPLSKHELEALGQRNAPLMQNAAHAAPGPYDNYANAWSFPTGDMPPEKPVLSRWARFMAWLK